MKIDQVNQIKAAIQAIVGAEYNLKITERGDIYFSASGAPDPTGRFDDQNSRQTLSIIHSAACSILGHSNFWLTIHPSSCAVEMKINAAQSVASDASENKQADSPMMTLSDSGDDEFKELVSRVSSCIYTNQQSRGAYTACWIDYVNPLKREVAQQREEIDRLNGLLEKQMGDVIDALHTQIAHPQNTIHAKDEVNLNLNKQITIASRLEREAAEDMYRRLVEKEQDRAEARRHLDVANREKQALKNSNDVLANQCAQNTESMEVMQRKIDDSEIQLGFTSFNPNTLRYTELLHAEAERGKLRVRLVEREGAHAATVARANALIIELNGACAERDALRGALVMHQQESAKLDDELKSVRAEWSAQRIEIGMFKVDLMRHEEFFSNVRAAVGLDDKASMAGVAATVGMISLSEKFLDLFRREVRGAIDGGGAPYSEFMNDTQIIATVRRLCDPATIAATQKEWGDAILATLHMTMYASAIYENAHRRLRTAA